MGGTLKGTCLNGPNFSLKLWYILDFFSPIVDWHSASFTIVRKRNYTETDALVFYFSRINGILRSVFVLEQKIKLNHTYYMMSF